MSAGAPTGRQARILAARTEALARPLVLERETGGTLLRLRVGGESFAIDPNGVRAVGDLRKITPLPHTPPRVLGLTSRGGSVVPVFDLRAVLGLALTTLPEHGRIVILGDNGDEVALVVEAVEGTTAEASELGPLPNTVGPGLRAVARGVTAEGMVVLDHERLLKSELLIIDSPLPR